MEISPVLLQRPSSKKPFAFSYYKEMIAAYLPDLQLGNLKLPPFPNFQSSMFQFALSGYLPQMPTIPVLSSAQEVVRTGLSELYYSVLGKEKGRKRKHDEVEGESGSTPVSSPSPVEDSPDTDASPSGTRRSIRVAVSQKQKQPKKRQPSPKTKTKIMDTLTHMMKPETNEKKMESNFNELGEQLTKELVQAALEAQNAIEHEENEKNERFDYFVQQDVMDNMIHQVK
jgi:hypothetical protein